MRLELLGPAILLALVACGGDDDARAIDAAGGETIDAGDGTMADAGGEGSVDGGETGADCGGLFGLQCDPPEYCGWDEDSCGTGDALGSCKARPSVCAPDGLPVCGCDGKPYKSVCAAAMAGTDIAEVSICRTSAP